MIADYFPQMPFYFGSHASQGRFGTLSVSVFAGCVARMEDICSKGINSVQKSCALFP